MGEAGGDFFHMVGNHDQGGGIRVGCQFPKVGNEVFPAAQVHAGAGLVEKQQFGVGHEGPSDEDSFAFAFAEGSPGAVGKMVGAHLGEHASGPIQVFGIVFFPPPTQNGVSCGDHQVNDFFAGGDAAGNRTGAHADSRPKVAHVGAADAFA